MKLPKRQNFGKPGHTAFAPPLYLNVRSSSTDLWTNANDIFLLLTIAIIQPATLSYTISRLRYIKPIMTLKARSDGSTI